MKTLKAFVLFAISLSSLSLQAQMKCGDVLAGDGVSMKVGVFGAKVQGTLDPAPMFKMTGLDNSDRLKLTMVVIPTDGVGRQLVIERYDNKRQIKLFWKLVLAYPQTYAKFGIFADQQRLVIPNDVRFNKLNAGGLQLLHLPPDVPQLYSNEFLVKHLRQWTEPKSTQGGLFNHDHFQDHMAGSIATPKWMYEKVSEFAEFQDQLLKIGESAKLPNDFRKNIEASETAVLWDAFTNRLGSKVVDLADTPGVVTAENILQIRQVLEQYDTAFSVSTLPKVLTTEEVSSGKLMSQVDFQIYTLHNMYGLTAEQVKPVEAQIRSMQAHVMTAPKTADRLTEDAIEIVREVTRIPSDKLREILAADGN